MGRSPEERRTSDWPCDEELETAARYVSAVRHAAGLATRRRALLSRSGAGAVVTVLRSLPVAEAAFTGSPAGRELASWFGRGRVPLLSRAPIAVLELPGSAAEYRRGRPRQALRTNVNRATALGLRCELLSCPAELQRSIDHIAGRRQQQPETMVRARADTAVRPRFTAVYDTAGDPVALSETVVDGAWAGLATLVTVPGYVDAAGAEVTGQLIRYLLHTHTVDGLIEQGVQRITVSGSMLLSSAGTRYFQRRTGYQPVRLRLTDAAPSLVPARPAAPVTALVPRPRAAADRQPATPGAVGV